MSLWMVRAGVHGEQEQFALDNGIITIGWNDLPDLSKVKTREELGTIYQKNYPNEKKVKAAIHIGQVWRFIHDFQKGDLVGMPLKTQSAIALGIIESDYQYKELRSDIKHIRRVKWLKTVPRSAFDQDILNSFGAILTVCKIERNDAENRIKKLLQLKDYSEKNSTIIPEEIIDIEGYSKDRIAKYIAAKFKGHDLARLVDAILQSQGYVTKRSPPGADGGVDILAAPGPLGFDSPRICVQVKSSQSPSDVKILRELQGVMSKVRADQGLLISWGGFTNSALQEARDAFFSIRLWDQGDIIEEIFRHYDKFDDELKAELPLKRIWSLVVEEE